METSMDKKDEERKRIQMEEKWSENKRFYIEIEAAREIYL